MSKSGMKRKVLFALEIIILLLFIGGLYAYGQITSRMQKIETTPLKQEEIGINPEVAKNPLSGFYTYALFGIDHREKNEELSGENSDTIIIASINNDTQEVRLVSVYRDTLLNIDGNDTYFKANAAYSYGGPEQAISMLNTNLDLNITQYATVDFNALTTVIDCLGGLDIPLSYEEMEHMNNYCVETSKETGKSYTPIEKPDPAPEDQSAILGTYHLNGVQATSYCRIRFTASLDMGRTERQRMVIGMIVDKAKKAGLTTIFDIMDQVFPMVKTSMTKSNILSMIPNMIGYKMEETAGFPFNYKFAKLSNDSEVIVAASLEDNVKELHKFLYGKEDYNPSQSVVQKDQRITEIVGGEEVLNALPTKSGNGLGEQAQPQVTVSPEVTAQPQVTTQPEGTSGEGYDNGMGYNGDGDYSGYSDTSGDYSGYSDGSDSFGDSGYADTGVFDDGSGEY